MKKIRAIVSSLITLCATGVLALAGCTNVVRYDKYANADLYTVGSASISAEKVQSVEIDWVNGNIEVEQTASQTLQVIEEKSSEKDAERMRYYLDGNVLKVKYCESGLRGNINTQNKNIRVEIPAGLSLEIDSVGAGITVGVLDVVNLSIESVSGNITAERIVSGEAEIETVSGKVSIGELIAPFVSLDSVSGSVSITRLSVDSLEAETVSGGLSFGVQKALTAEVESTSAEVTFILGEGLGATVRLETATGKLKTEKQFGKSGMRYDVYGADGTSTECKIQIETFSGNVNIL